MCTHFQSKVRTAETVQGITSLIKDVTILSCAQNNGFCMVSSQSQGYVLTHLCSGICATTAIAADVCADIADAQLGLRCLCQAPGLYWQPLALLDLPNLTALSPKVCRSQSPCQLRVCDVCD